MLEYDFNSVEDVDKSLVEQGITPVKIAKPVEAPLIQPTNVSTGMNDIPEFSAPANPPIEVGGNLQEPEAPQELTAGDYAMDIALAPFRGVAGAVESVGELATLGMLPDNLIMDRVGHSKTAVGGLVEGASEFMTGFIPVFGWLGKASKVGKLAKLGSVGRWIQNSEMARGLVAGAVADFTVFDSHEERLSNLIQQFPALQNPVTDFLEAEGDDSLLEGRIKNVLEGAMVGSAIEGIIVGFRGLKKAKGLLAKGDKAGAEKVLEEAGEEIQPKLQQAEAEAVQTESSGAIQPFSEGQSVNWDFNTGKPLSEQGQTIAEAANKPREQIPVGVNPYVLKLPSSTTSYLIPAAKKGKKQPYVEKTVGGLMQSMLDGWDEVVSSTTKKWEADTAAGSMSNLVGTRTSQAAQLTEFGLQNAESRLIEGRDWNPVKLGNVTKPQLDQMLTGLKTVTEEILRLSSDEVKNVRVEWGSKRTRPYYSTFANKIVLSGWKDTGSSFLTPIHEVVHALTANQINIGLKPFIGVREKTGLAFKTALESAQKNSDVVQPLKDLISSYMESATRLGVDDVLFNKKNGTAGKEPDKTTFKGVAYGFGNLAEFTAQALSSPGFQTQLASIKMEKGGNAFSTLVGAIADILGMDIDKTMLERVIRQTAELAGAPRPSGNTWQGVSAMGVKSVAEGSPMPIRPEGTRVTAEVAQGATPQAPRVEVNPDTLTRVNTFLNVIKSTPKDIDAMRKALLGKPGDRPLINIGDHASPDSFNRAVVATVKTIEDALNRAPGEVRDLDTLGKEAIDLINKVGGRGTLEMLSKDVRTTKGMDARVKAYQFVITDIMDQIGKKAQSFEAAKAALAADRTNTEAVQAYTKNLIEISEVMDTAREALFGYKRLGTEQGRALAARRWNRQAATMAEYARALIDQAGGQTAIEDAMSKLSTIYKKHGASAIAMMAPDKLWINAHNELWINFLLSGPKTFSVNAIATMMSTLTKPFESAIGAQRLAMFAKDQATKNQYKLIRNEFLNSYGYMMESWREALSLGIKAFKESESQLSKSSSPVEFKRIITAKNFNIENPTLAGMVNFFGTVVNTPTRLLTGADEFFKQINYRSYAKAKATMEAYETLGDRATPELVAEFVTNRLDNVIMKNGQKYSKSAVRMEGAKLGASQGLRGLELEEFIGEHVVKNFDPTKQALADYAFDVSQEVTFTRRGERLPNGDPTMQMTLERIASQHPTLRLVLPFVTTPMNILKYVGQRSTGAVAQVPGIKKLPFLNAEKMRLARELADADPMVRAAAEGKIAVGLGLVSTAIYAAASGTITGGGPEDEQERKLKIASGWRPYSFKVGDKYISYQRLDPFSSFLGLAADIHDRSNSVKAQDENALQTAVASMAVAFAKNITNKSYLAGIEQITDAFSQPERFAPRLLQNRVSSLLVPAAVSQAVGAFGGDNYMLEARGYFDQIFKRIPGGDQFVDPVRNALGEKVVVPSLAPGLDYINPITVSTKKNDPVMDEMVNLQHGFSLPSVIQDGGINLAEITNPKGQTAYDRWLELQSQVRINGLTLRQSLEKTIRSPQYKKLSDQVLEDFDSPRTKTLQRVISGYRAFAKEALLKEFSTVNNLVTKSNRVKLALRRGENVEELLSQLQQ